MGEEKVVTELNDSVFKNYLPVFISKKSYQELEKSIIAEGCRDPIVVWGNIIVDGHNRYEICQCHNVPFKTISKEFTDREEAMIWILNNQAARRNLNERMMRVIRGMRHDLEKEKEHSGRQNDAHPGKTSERLAKEYDVSPRTIERDAKFAKGVDSMPPELRAKVVSREGGLTNQQVIDWPNLKEEEKQKILSGESKKAKKEIVGERIEKPEDENKKDEPEALWNLKRWWKRTTKKDKKIFLKWIQNTNTKPATTEVPQTEIGQ